ASRLTSEKANGTTRTYTYDNANQVTADGSSTFTFDGTGNRTNTGYATTTMNEVTSDGTWNYTYDAEGNETKKVNITTGETWTYGYDNRDELIWAEDRATDGGTLLQRLDFKYDAWGNRVEKDLTDGGITTVQRYALDGWKTAQGPLG